MAISGPAGEPVPSEAPTKPAKKTKMVTGVFDSRDAAGTAIEALVHYGRSRDDISVMMSAATRSKSFGFETGTHAADAAGIGGAVGGATGALLAALAAVGTNVILPGLGLVVAGPLAAAFAGAGAGGAAGSLIGALIGAGIPEHRAKVMDAGIRKGGLLLGVEVQSLHEAEIIEMVLKQHGAHSVRRE